MWLYLRILKISRIDESTDEEVLLKMNKEQLKIYSKNRKTEVFGPYDEERKEIWGGLLQSILRSKMIPSGRKRISSLKNLRT